MKTLLYVTLGALLACPVLANAQSTNSAPDGPPPEGGPGGGHHHGPDFSFLTADQKAELKKDHDAAIAANPSLATQLEAAHEQMKQNHENGTEPTEAQKQQMHSLMDQMDQAMIKIDPNVKSILDEIKAHRPHHGPGGPGGGEGGPGGPGGSNGAPPPPDSGT